MRFIITEHAVNRWRQRAATYGDDGVQHVEAALQQSRRITDLSEMPFAVTPGTHYYRHPPTGIYFVAVPLDRDTAVVVTCKTDLKQRPAGTPVARESFTLPLPELPPRPAFTTLEERRAHVADELATVKAMLSMADSRDENRWRWKALKKDLNSEIGLLDRLIAHKRRENNVQVLASEGL